MSAVKIRAALEGALAAMSPTLATAYENFPFTPPAASVAYQRAHLMFAQPDNPEMTASYEEHGLFQVMLAYPPLDGPVAASSRAELIRSTFKRGQAFTSGGVTVRIERTPEIKPGFVDSDRFNVVVRIPFRAPITV